MSGDFNPAQAALPPFSPTGSISGGRAPTGVNGMATILPTRGGSSSIAPVLPTRGGGSDIAPQGRNTSITANEKPLVYHLMEKPWTQKGPLQPFGNQLSQSGHDKQKLPGDVCFVNDSGSSNSTGKIPGLEHLVVSAELAKLNEILAIGYYELKKDFDNPGLGLSDGNTLTKKGYATATSNTAQIHGIDFTQVLQNAYDLWKPDDEIKIQEMTMNQVLMDYSLMDYPEGGISVSDEISDDGANLHLGNRSYIAPFPRVVTNYPDNHIIYNRHFQHFPAKDKYANNGFGIYNSKEQENHYKSIVETMERRKIDEAMEYLSNESIDIVDDSNHRQALKMVFDWSISGILASSPKYIQYATLAGIANTWRFIGVVKSTGDGLGPIRTMSPTGNSSTVNYYIKGPAKTTNRWGSNIPPNTKLWLILKKLRYDGPYQLIPWYDKSKGLYSGNGWPTDLDRVYYDENKSLKKGISIYLGRTRREYSDSFNDEIRSIANGISTTRNPISFEAALVEKTRIASAGSLELVLGS